MRRLLPGLALAAIVSAFPGSGRSLAHGQTYVTPKQLALTQRDVPPGFREIASGAVSNAKADRGDGLPAGTFERHGRITSYETYFRHTRDRTATIVDNVIAFRSASGAHWEFLRSVNKGRKALFGQGFRRMRVKGFGNEAAGYLYQQVLGSTLITCGATLFRRGSYAAWVITCGRTQFYSLKASPILASILDKNIRSATGAR